MPCLRDKCGILPTYSFTKHEGHHLTVQVFDREKYNKCQHKTEKSGKHPVLKKVVFKQYPIALVPARKPYQIGASVHR